MLQKAFPMVSRQPANIAVTAYFVSFFQFPLGKKLLRVNSIESRIQLLHFCMFLPFHSLFYLSSLMTVLPWLIIPFI